MLTLKLLTEYLNQYLNCSLITDYCPNGLQVEGKDVIVKIATGVSADLETIRQTVEINAQALIVHHGIFWNKDSHIIDGTKRKKLKLLLENNISLLTYHLPLDAHQDIGNNWKAAKEMGWVDLKPFCKVNGFEIGVHGKFGRIAVESFLSSLEDFYGHTAMHALFGKKQVASCALVSGGAWREMLQAARMGIDCFITGSFDEPAWSIAKEEGINFFALGHAATEKIGIRALGRHLEDRFSIASEFIDTNNPF